MGTDDPDGFPPTAKGPCARYASARSRSTRARSPTSSSRASSTRPATSPRRSASAGRSCSTGLLRGELRRHAARSRRAPWWLPVVRRVAGAARRGRQLDLDDAADHPVVHVSWNDARRTARGRARACRRRRSGSTPRAAASSRRRYPWGDELTPGGRAHAATSGRALSRRRTPPTTATSARRRSTLPAERLRAVQHGRQRLGVVCDWFHRRHCRGRRPTARGRGEGDSRRFVPVPRIVLQPLPRRRANEQHAGEHDRPHRIPMCGVPMTDTSSPIVFRELSVRRGHRGPTSRLRAPSAASPAAARICTTTTATSTGS